MCIRDSFPLVVAEALMIEPTETESKETLDAFADTLLKIKNEDPETVRTAPHTHIISRPDEVKAAKEPILRWTPKHDQTAPAGAVTSGTEVLKREW